MQLAVGRKQEAVDGPRCCLLLSADCLLAGSPEVILHHSRRALLAADHGGVEAAGLGPLGGEVQPWPVAAVARQPRVQSGRLVELSIRDAVEPQRLVAGQRGLGGWVARKHAVQVAQAALEQIRVAHLWDADHSRPEQMLAWR